MQTSKSASWAGILLSEWRSAVVMKKAGRPLVGIPGQDRLVGSEGGMLLGEPYNQLIKQFQHMFSIVNRWIAQNGNHIHADILKQRIQPGR